MIQDREIEKAQEELKKVENPEIFRSIGPIVVKADKSDIDKELEETREEIELKIKTLEKQEKRLKDKLKENQDRFQSLMPRGGEGG